MKLFIWERVDHVTDRWHDDGGIVVVAADLDKAREEMHAHAIPVDCEAYRIDPDCVYQVADTDEPGVVAVFPNAGCC